MNLLAPELLEKARQLPRPVVPHPLDLDLPSAKEMEDARWQQQYAGSRVLAFVETLREKLAHEPIATATARAAYDRNAAFVRALDFFFQVNADLLTLLDQREEEMREGMATAQFTFRQMRLDRDFFQQQIRTVNQRYYAEKDLAALLSSRLHPSPVALTHV